MLCLPRLPFAWPLGRKVAARDIDACSEGCTTAELRYFDFSGLECEHDAAAKVFALKFSMQGDIAGQRNDLLFQAPCTGISH